MDRPSVGHGTYIKEAWGVSKQAVMNALAQETDETVISILPPSLRKGYDLKLLLVTLCKSNSV